MKKITTILLISIYALSSFGFGIKQFYCCGKLKSTTISFEQNTKEKCGMGDEKSSCCKTKFHSLKVKDCHIAADILTNPVKHFSEAINFYPLVENIGLAKLQLIVNHPSHAPPLLYHGTPLYILHSVYRI